MWDEIVSEANSETLLTIQLKLYFRLTVVMK